MAVINQMFSKPDVCLFRKKVPHTAEDHKPAVFTQTDMLSISYTHAFHPVTQFKTVFILIASILNIIIKHES